MTTSTDRASVPGALLHVSLLVALAACGDGPNQASGPDATTVRDSAGVRIVTSERPRWGAGAGWKVTPEPAVTIGTDDAVGGDETDILPGGFAAHEVANDRMYGVYTAPHGAQTVRVYRIVRH